MMTQFGAPEIERQEMVAVEQVDRDSAIAAGRSWARWLPEQVRIVEEGRGDYCNLVQAFARHRIALESAHRAALEQIAGLSDEAYPGCCQKIAREALARGLDSLSGHLPGASRSSDTLPVRLG